MKYTVFEIQFWSVNCTAVTLGYTQNFEQHFIPPMQCSRNVSHGQWIDLMKKNHFKMLLTYLVLHLLIQILYYIDYSISEK